jgi:Reverse transcriptase (RNA-dependent DNA polymerase)
VARGYTQEKGIDYIEIFSFVVKPVTIRTLLTIALSKGWPLHQLYVNNVFLHEDLQEQVYMAQPPSFINQDNPNYVCRLKKALYGLKQAPRTWFNRLHDLLVSLPQNLIPASSSNITTILPYIFLFTLMILLLLVLLKP